MLRPHILSSWKEIAIFLGKGVRTVQRWENCSGLPIHRPSGIRGSVFAYRTELDEWCHKLWMDNKSAPNAKLASEARAAESHDMLRFVLELANSCAELNRKNEELRCEAARGRWNSRQMRQYAELLPLLGEYPQIREAHLFVMELLKEYPLPQETWLIPAPRSATSMLKRATLFALPEPAFPNLQDASDSPTN